jgi:hypothetical protein
MEKPKKLADGDTRERAFEPTREEVAALEREGEEVDVRYGQVVPARGV